MIISCQLGVEKKEAGRMKKDISKHHIVTASTFLRDQIAWTPAPVGERQEDNAMFFSVRGVMNYVDIIMHVWDI